MFAIPLEPGSILSPVFPPFSIIKPSAEVEKSFRAPALIWLCNMLPL